MAGGVVAALLNHRLRGCHASGMRRVGGDVRGGDYCGFSDLGSQVRIDKGADSKTEAPSEASLTLEKNRLPLQISSRIWPESA